MNTRVTIAGDCILKLAQSVRMHEDKVRGRTVLLAPELTVALDETGIAILDRLDGNNSVETITKSLALIYETPKDVIMQDTILFLQDLVDRQFLKIA